MDNIFRDNIFKCILLNENFWLSPKNSLKYVPWGQIVSKPSLVQIMGFRRTGDKPLFEPMVVQFTDAYMCHSTSMS